MKKHFMKSSLKHTLLFSLLTFILVGCGGSSTDGETLLDKATPYFSQTEGAFSGGIDAHIIDDIDHASESILLAMYDFTNDNIADALLEAALRGVSIQIMTDDSKLEDSIYQRLKEANITIYNDENPYALMHNKFLIIDTDILWMGSANFTYYAFYRNNETMLRWEYPALALAYTEEFHELTVHETVDKPYEEESIALYFSPEDTIRDRLIEKIDQAKEEISFMIYTFTDPSIAEALIAAHKRGVTVQGIFDESQNSYQTYSQYDHLLEGGIAVKLDGNSYKLHDKVMIIDKAVTIVGSYNYTDAANSSNAENVLILEDRDLASLFLSEFDLLFREAQ